MKHADSVAAIIEELTRSGDPARRAGMERYGINTSRALGNSMPAIRALAKTVGRDHALALEVWDTGVHDARLLCAFIDEAQMVTPAQMDRWARDFDSWDVTDQVCNNLFSRTPHAVAAVRRWAPREEEFVRRAAFATMASLAVHARSMDEGQFLAFIPLIRAAADDPRNFVKKAVNWALRQIGKRSLTLRDAAIGEAEALVARESPAARWVGRDALRELHRPEILERVRKKSAR